MTGTKPESLHASSARLSRRAILLGVGSIPFATTVASLTHLRALAANRVVAGFSDALLPSLAEMERWLALLNTEFGPIRATGSPACRAFEDWLAARFSALGCTMQRDQYRLMSWQASVEDDCSIEVSVDGESGSRPIEVLSYLPFAATTRAANPVSGRLLYAPGDGTPAGVTAAAEAIVATTPADALAKSIVVIDAPLAANTAYLLHPETFPADLQPPEPALYAASQGGAGAMTALDGKCAGAILCFTNISDDHARYTYLPFSGPHRKTPALWVGKASSAFLRSISGRATASLRLDATLTPDARADTLIATLPGQSDEVIFLTTHTDGPNEVNDNGALGVLAIATYLSRVPQAKRRRTLVCCLPTGHYAAGAIADPATGSGKRAGTAGALQAHPEIAARIIGQLALEQLGAREWLDDASAHYVATGKVAPEFYIPTPSLATTVNPLLLACARDQDPTLSRTYLVRGGFAPGEGGGLRALNLPGAGLMGVPSYFFRADPKGVLDKLDTNVFRNQTALLTKMVLLMDRLSVDQLNGRATITEDDLLAESDAEALDAGTQPAGPPNRLTGNDSSGC